MFRSDMWDCDCDGNRGIVLAWHNLAAQKIRLSWHGKSAARYKTRKNERQERKGPKGVQMSQWRQRAEKTVAEHYFSLIRFKGVCLPCVCILSCYLCFSPLSVCMVGSRRDAEANKDREKKAAIRIQCVWRGFIVRKHFQKLQ